MQNRNPGKQPKRFGTERAVQAYSFCSQCWHDPGMPGSPFGPCGPGSPASPDSPRPPAPPRIPWLPPSPGFPSWPRPPGGPRGPTWKTFDLDRNLRLAYISGGSQKRLTLKDGVFIHKDSETHVQIWSSAHCSCLHNATVDWTQLIGSSVVISNILLLAVADSLRLLQETTHRM